MATDKILARVLNKSGDFWIFHKSLIEDYNEQNLEKKPDEKLWKIVKTNLIPGLEFPAH